jgi:hypothetical protein
MSILLFQHLDGDDIVEIREVDAGAADVRSDHLAGFIRMIPRGFG